MDVLAEALGLWLRGRGSCGRRRQGSGASALAAWAVLLTTSVVGASAPPEAEHLDLSRVAYSNGGAASSPFYCEDGLTRWEIDWPRPKKRWCCSHRGLGCPKSATASIPAHADRQNLDKAMPVVSCNGRETEWAVCANLPSCPHCVAQDCLFSDWNDWSMLGHCTGLGVRERSIMQNSNECGAPCEGAKIETVLRDEFLPESCHSKEHDCKWGLWGSWSDCGAAPGQKFRYRRVEKQVQLDGRPCEGAWNETKPCLEVLPHDCDFSDWGEWTQCSAPCNGGWKAQMRHIRKPASGGGLPCEGALRQTFPCNTQLCHPELACRMGDWDHWRGCEASEERQQYRRRVILEPSANALGYCNYPITEIKGCAGNGKVSTFPCSLTQWSDWSRCSRPSGGQKLRTRSLPAGQEQACFQGTPLASLKQTAPCGATRPLAPIGVPKCDLTIWSEWSLCSDSCGMGTSMRKRQVSRPSRCDAGLSEVKPCSNGPCMKTDCFWGDWDPWSACTCSCGGGTHRRSRVILQAPRNGGALCDPNDKSEVRPCNIQSCLGVCIDGAWGEWSEWAPCSSSCAPAHRVRHRDIMQRANHCGKPATGLEDEYELCQNAGLCDLVKDCEISAWSTWSECSSRCSGVRERARRIESYASSGGRECPSGTSFKEIEPCHAGIDHVLPDDCGPHKQVSCLMSSWEDWHPCTASCGGGDQMRYRHIVSPNRNNGAPCDKPLVEVTACNKQRCGALRCVDCEWGEWSDWGDCSKCGGQRYRHRSIKTQANFCGKACSRGAAKEVSSCLSPCEKVQDWYCTWSTWSDMEGDGCAKECGRDTKMRKRHLRLSSEKPAASEGFFFKGSEIVPCSATQIGVVDCPYISCETICSPKDCRFGAWGEWAEPTCTQLCERHRSVVQESRCGGEACGGSLVETKRCRKTGCEGSQDCVLGDWAFWSTCVDDGGQRMRRRELRQPHSGGGKACSGALVQTMSCAVPVPEDTACLLSGWGEWGQCSRQCGGGSRTRSRHVEREASKGGEPCTASIEELGPCRSQPCGAGDSQPCQLSAWSPWGDCDEGDTQSRFRQVVAFAQGDGTPCYGSTKEVRVCAKKVDCLLSDWTVWGNCDKTCGGGQQQRHRQVLINPRRWGKACSPILVETRGCHDGIACVVGAVDCQISQWSKWGDCSAVCGPGQKLRTREVTRLPQTSGHGCNGQLAESAPCRSGSPDCRPASQDCVWGQWSSWSSCNKRCDGGQQTRERVIMVLPKQGGRPCAPVDKSEMRACNMHACSGLGCIDGLWGTWSEWGLCSATCRGGFSWRTRRVQREANHCGYPALGPSKEHRHCNRRVPCLGSSSPDTDCVFGNWMQWGSCSKPCNGVRKRSRRIAIMGSGAGRGCKGSLLETWPCGDGSDCPSGGVDCEIGDWSRWGECDAQCGVGQMLRTRNLLGKGCHGSLSQTAPCISPRPCETPTACVAQDCRWSHWTTWSACDKCGGQQLRSRHIIAPPRCGGSACHAGQAEEIAKCPRSCHGVGFCSWSEWSPYSQCSATCGSGLRSRTRVLQAGGMSGEARRKLEHVANLSEAELEQKFERLRSRTNGLEARRVQELVACWVAGSLSLAAAAAALRAVSGRSWGDATVGDGADGCSARRVSAEEAQERLS